MAMMTREEANRALHILHRLSLEHIGWRSFWRRWVYSDEPLRHDAANFLRSMGFQTLNPHDTRLVGDKEPRDE